MVLDGFFSCVTRTLISQCLDGAGWWLTATGLSALMVASMLTATGSSALMVAVDFSNVLMGQVDG